MTISCSIDPVALVRDLEWDERRDLLTAIVDIMAVSDIVDAFEDAAATAVCHEREDVQPLTERGTALLDCFADRAMKLGRLPEDFESEAMRGFASDADRLHEAVCDGRIADACALLREMCPDHPFMTDAARLMLARARGQEAML